MWAAVVSFVFILFVGLFEAIMLFKFAIVGTTVWDPVLKRKVNKLWYM